MTIDNLAMSNQQSAMTARGFTLIELLIVIAILAVLATTVALVLNPAELLRQARDAQRFADLSAVESAVSLFVASVSSPTVGLPGGSPRCTATGSNWNGSLACTQVTSTAVNGAGWVNVNLTQVPGGSPLGRLPMDPNNDATPCRAATPRCFYGFSGDDTTKRFKLQTVLESDRYSGRMLNVNDGGTGDLVYEVGSNLGL